MAALSQTGRHVDVDRPSESYEALFNQACSLLSNGKATLAFEVLKRARSKCSVAMKEEQFSTADIEQELLLISVQEAFAYQLLGESEKARSIYSDVLEQQ